MSNLISISPCSVSVKESGESISFLELAKARYTTKKYDQNKIVSDDKIKDLKEILQLSPSSINSQPWKFSFISGEQIKRELASVSYWNEQKINEASHLVVFSAIDNIVMFEKQIQQNLSKGSIDYYNQYIKSKPEAEIKSWFQHQVYLSLGFFLSACASMGVDSTTMEGIKNEEYDKILKLEGFKTLFAVAIGYRDISDSNQPGMNPKSRLSPEKIIQPK